MKIALVPDKQAVRLIDAPVPRPPAGCVRVRVRACGICGSDLHIFRGHWRNGKLGHEVCGVVDQVADDVTDLAPGTRVCAECFGHCGQCVFCRSGRYNHCPSISWYGWQEHGAMAEYTCFPARSVFAVPDALSDAEAVMVEPLAVAFHAVRRAHLEPGSAVGIVGAGTIGLLCAATARTQGAGRVVVVARHAHQAEAARRLGADDVALIGRDNPAEVLGPDRMVDAAIDTVAAGTSFSTALAAVRSCGRMVLVGGVTRPIMAALAPLVDREIELTGSQCYAVTDGKPDFQWAIELIASGRVDAGGLVTHTFPLADVEEAFHTAADKTTGATKVVVQMAD
ncbi:MAG: alcohol dehydrogenase catalytic domain-containing protein [Candidatus Brocadiaceae bacterium]|nr:alcohol dehydrogenase catalytic domain-containing protein [Candidatus Brocadiaceae bacterium]